MGRFNGWFTVLIEPVTAAGDAIPSPARKILTMEPARAGLTQVFREPSSLKASGKGPPE
ncbi:MAG TPA: hypothetical protein VNH18_01835 [Bryobacteraceae bacterium]|nr:hypothetical protein [Bryobacteraceae bacterium]